MRRDVTLPTPFYLLYLLLLLLLFPQVIEGCWDYPVVISPILTPHKNASKVFRIGGFATSHGNPIVSSLMKLAIFMINNNQSILEDVLLELYFAELTGTDTGALLASHTLISHYGVRATIGGIFTSETSTAQLSSRFFKVPQIAATSLGSILSNKLDYPYLARVIPPDTYQAEAIASVMQHYGWGKAMVIYGDDDYGTYGLDNIRKSTPGNFTLYSLQIPTSTTNFNASADTVIDYIKRFDVRIFIIYTQWVVGTSLMKNLYDRGYINQSYVYILSFGLSYNGVTFPDLYPDYYYLDGAIGLTPEGITRDGFGKTVFDLWNSVDQSIFPGARPDASTAWYYIDAVLSVAIGLDKLLKSGYELDDINGTTLYDSIRTSNFTGATGNVSFDQNSDRIGNYVWFNIVRNRTEACQVVAEYSPITKTTTFFSSFSFYDGVKYATDGVCYCKQGKCNIDGICICPAEFSGPLCEIYSPFHVRKFTTGEIVLVVVLPVSFVFLLAVFSFKFLQYKRSQMIKELAQQQRSIIKSGDIILQNRIGRGASGEVFKGMLRGTEVAVKRLIMNATKASMEEFELECAIMTGLRHPNIVLFLGNCYVPETKELLLVLELMERGSLNDIIHNQKILITRELSLNIAYQAAKGMNFLHRSNPPIIHRDLKSHNILLDDKWNARISDFGITKVKSLKETKSKKDLPASLHPLGTIYWTAPEVFEGKPHTEASDCYSFGIVLWELWHRKTPYDGKEPMAVAVNVIAPNNLRPEMNYSISPEVRDLITSCWAPEPSARPTFEEIMERIKVMMNPLSGANTVSGPLSERDYGVSEPPTGVVYFIQTEIEHSSDLWESIPMVMLEAITHHNKLLRKNIENFGGYEVEFRDSGFFVAFGSLSNALNWCVECQKCLLYSSWPEELLAQSMCKVKKGSNGNNIWNGLRSRMAVHAGVPDCDIDKASNRMKYFGSVVNYSKMLLPAMRRPGSIIISSAVMEAINMGGVTFADELSYEECGEILDTTTKQSEPIYKVIPKSLSERDHLPTSSSSSGLPHTIIPVEEEVGGTEDDAVEVVVVKKHASVIPIEDLKVRESIGKGAIGDYRKCCWKGQKVAMKMLINQKLEEQDILTLQAHSSVLSKIRHKNLVDFYGVCLEPGQISIIIEYLPKRGLPSLLADTSFPMDFNLKLSIAKQIAEGMEFVASHDQEWVAIHESFKSSNILITDKMTVKISDVGQGNLKDLARTMTSVGSIAWTAPELLNGDPEHPSISIYAFGIILWEIYTRKLPYHDQHPIRVVAQILNGYRPPIPSDCPPKYTKLIQQCWDPEIEARPTWKQALSQLNSINM